MTRRSKRSREGEGRRRRSPGDPAPAGVSPVVPSIALLLITFVCYGPAVSGGFI